MVRFEGKSATFCDGFSRRNFLQIGALGIGLSLTDLLRAQAAQKAQGKPTQVKSAIMIYLPGGPSHMDMYDLKPEAPAEFRGEFKPIHTNVNGIQITEHFPLQAKMFDKFALIRSLVTVDEHSDTFVMTGYPDRVNRNGAHPSFGSFVSKIRGSSADPVPPFVSLRGMTRGTEPGYLGIAHRPFTPSGQGQANLKLPNSVSPERLEERKNLLDEFDTIRRDMDASGTMTGLDSFNQKAIEMVTSGIVRDALDIKKEDPKTCDRYKGVEQFLTARRLIQAGVGCVTLSIGSWDTHGQNFTQLKRMLPQVDKGISNLIQDLHDLGLNDDVVTIMWGEFGRTPKINSGAGRDHWSPAMSALIAGGGLKMGQVVGATTAKGERPKDRPYSPSNVLSTIYQTIGIDPSQTFVNGSGRPMYVLDDREIVKELV
jgi:hypothetical protein